MGFLFLPWLSWAHLLAMAFMADLQGVILPNLFMNFFLVVENLSPASFNWQTSILSQGKKSTAVMVCLGSSVKPILLDTFIELFIDIVNKLRDINVSKRIVDDLNQMKISLKTSSIHFTSNYPKMTHGLSYGVLNINTKCFLTNIAIE